MFQHRPVGRGLTLRNGLDDAQFELVDAPRIDRVDARQVHRFDGLAGGAFYGPQHVALARRDEQNGLAAAARPAGAADAMDIGLGIIWDVIIDHMTDAFNVESARRDVGRDQDVDLAGLEPRHGAFAQRLRDVAVERRGGEAARLQLLGQFDRGLFGAGEHQHAVEALGLQDARQGIQLVHAAHQPIALPDVGGGAGLALDGDFDRGTQVLLGDAPDGRGQGGGKQRDLALRRSLLQDAFHGVDEAHVQHLVGFIENQQGQSRELQRASIHVIDHATRGSHHHMHTAPQGVQLRLIALAAVDGQYMKALDVRGVAQECLGHL